MALPHPVEPMENGRHPFTPRRTLPADVAKILRRARRARGWSGRRAARELGIAASYLCHLEHGERVPSTTVAELLIQRYGLSSYAASKLRAVARPGVGRDSPWRSTNRSAFT